MARHPGSSNQPGKLSGFRVYMPLSSETLWGGLASVRTIASSRIVVPGGSGKVLIRSISVVIDRSQCDLQVLKEVVLNPEFSAFGFNEAINLLHR